MKIKYLYFTDKTSISRPSITAVYYNINPRTIQTFGFTICSQLEGDGLKNVHNFTLFVLEGWELFKKTKPETF